MEDGERGEWCVGGGGGGGRGTSILLTSMKWLTYGRYFFRRSLRMSASI